MVSQGQLGCHPDTVDVENFRQGGFYYFNFNNSKHATVLLVATGRHLAHRLFD